MVESSALHAALALLRDPASVREYHRTELPGGIRVMLAIVVSDEDAITQAQRYTGQSRATLIEAATFFVEQVLFDRHSDSYRVLGGTRGSSYEDLRHNMTLLMRWLHPDLQIEAGRAAIVREVFSTRVTRAWDDLKTEERRRAYDRKHPLAVTVQGTVARKTIDPGTKADVRGNSHRAHDGAPADLRTRRRRRARFRERLASPLSLRKLQGDSFWVRLIRLFKSNS